MSQSFSNFIYVRKLALLQNLQQDNVFRRPGIARALEDFKLSVYGENHDQEEADKTSSKSCAGEATKKRKANAEAAVGSYSWAKLADEGKVRLCSNYYYFTLMNIAVDRQELQRECLVKALVCN